MIYVLCSIPVSQVMLLHFSSTMPLPWLWFLTFFCKYVLNSIMLPITTFLSFPAPFTDTPMTCFIIKKINFVAFLFAIYLAIPQNSFLTLHNEECRFKDCSTILDNCWLQLCFTNKCITKLLWRDCILRLAKCILCVAKIWEETKPILKPMWMSLLQFCHHSTPDSIHDIKDVSEHVLIHLWWYVLFSKQTWLVSRTIVFIL